MVERNNCWTVGISSIMREEVHAEEERRPGGSKRVYTAERR